MYVCGGGCVYTEPERHRQTEEMDKETDKRVLADTVEISEKFPCLQNICCYNVVSFFK